METILKLLLSGGEENLVNTVSTYIEKYKPTAYALLKELLKIYEDYANNTEFPALAAKTKKNMFDAYVGAGFTEEQAMAFLINSNLERLEYVKKIGGSSSRKSDK